MLANVPSWLRCLRMRIIIIDSSRLLMLGKSDLSGDKYRVQLGSSGAWSFVLSLSSSSYFPAMSKNDLKKRICSLSKNDLKDLVKTYHIPVVLHPRLPDPGFTIDRLPADAIGIYSEFLRFSGIHDLPTDGYDRNDVQRLCDRLICLREMREEVLVRSGLSSVCDAKITEESHHLSLSLLKHVPSHTTTREMEGAIILLPTPDRIAASLPDYRLVKKSKGPSHASRPSKKRKLPKRDLEAGSSAPELDQDEGTDEADLADLCTEIEDSLERDEGVSMRAVSAPTPRLGKRLGAPPSIVVMSASEPSHVRTSASASTSGHGLSLGGVVASGCVGKSEAEVMRRQMDSLNCLARSALAHDAEYDQIPNDDFGIATRGEEIDLTLFTLAFSPYHMSYPYEDVCMKALDQTITPAELRRTESLLQLELSNRVNVLSALLVSHGYGVDSGLCNLVSSNAYLQEKFDKKKGDVKLLRLERDAASKDVRKLQSQLTDAKTTSASLSEELTRTDAKLSEQALTVRDMQNELVMKKSKSQEYKDAMDGLREEVTHFVGSGVESLVQKLLSSDEFHAALAHVASLGINYGVERGLRMGRTDVEFEAVVQKVSNFRVGAKADFDKALDDFPTTPFPFFSKIVAAS
ncbi:hypothetical protein Tco_0964325 [Tanacetum coccineum]